MDSCKALHNDCSSSKMSRLQSCMFSTASLAVVLISNYNPLHSFSLKNGLSKLISLTGVYHHITLLSRSLVSFATVMQRSGAFYVEETLCDHQSNGYAGD